MLRRGQAGGRRRGLNRVEVLVLLLIGMVLLGLLATVLVRGREAAGRVQCANNLRILGAAVLKYQKNIGSLPPARVGGRHATWAVVIAPYLTDEQHNPLKLWDASLPYELQEEKVRAGQIPVYYCPARRRPPLNSLEGDGPDDAKHYPGSLGDYACVAGDGDPKRPWDGPDANGPFVIAEVLKQDGDRVVRWKSRVRLEDLRRGGVTLLLGDKHVSVTGRGTVAAGDGSLYNGAHPISFARVGGPGFLLAASDDEPLRRNFGGSHAGVVQFVAADGSLKTFTPDVLPPVLDKLMIRDPD